jgi:ATP-dependent Clp protease ATP-binding subunit ClpC
MPKVNVYLSDDLADAVKDAGLPVSAICQRALELAVRRVTAVRETAGGRYRDLVEGAAVTEFTGRVMDILDAARTAAAADDVSALDSGYLLRAMISDRDSMAVRVLTALDITRRHVQAELDRRSASTEPSASTSAGPAASVAPDVAKALELAANESSALGTSYVGTEHLLLGMIGEPEGVAGHVLRFLGADLRVTRRTVAAALAGWDAGSARAAQQQDAASHLADHVATAVRAELVPVLERIERLEGMAAR